MHLTRIQLRIFASFGVALIVITTGWVGAGALTSAMAMRERARHSRQVADAVNAIQMNVLESETSQRGYLLTMDKRYLAAYQATTVRPDPIAALRKAFGATAEGDATLTRLAQNFAEKRAEMDSSIQIANEKGVDVALRHVAEGRGQRLAEAMRFDLDELTRREQQSRDDFSQRTDSKLKLSRVVVLSGTLLAFALAVIVNLSLMTAVRASEEAQRLVESQSLQLRKHTEALLEHERQLADQLTREQELGKALQRSNEELDQFAYATSHDLKAPLRGIMNLASFVEEDLGAGAPGAVKENLEMLRGRARRLEALIDGILAYSRAGRVRTKLERVDTAALVREVAELIAPPGGCTIKVVEPLPVLSTERVPLQQVFMNLVQNAIKHGCPSGTGTIEVGAEQQGDITKFYVKDEGPGIAAEYHDRVFGVFQTLAPRDQVEGTGIGLAVVKKLVETRGGRVLLESAAGKGARFTFVWPTVSPV